MTKNKTRWFFTFSHKMINKGIENCLLKKKNTQREPQPIKCSHFKVMMPLYLSVIYQLCYYTFNKKRAFKSIELIELYLLFFRSTYQTHSPMRRTFLLIGSRCAQPLTQLNAYALRYEFSKWRTGQRGK